MKIRTGFVSNSSSSSFCVFGCPVPNKRSATFNYIKKYMTEEDFIGMCWNDESKPKYKKLYKEIQEFDCYHDASDGLETEDAQLLDELIADLALDVALTYAGENEFYAGLKPSEGKDEETFKEFKERAKKLADDLIGEGHDDLEWECETYYD